MKILFLGIGDPVPTFIMRRLNHLASKGLKCYVAVDKKCSDRFEKDNIQTIVLPGLRISDSMIWLRLLAQIMVSPLKLIKLFFASPKGFSIPFRIYWTLRNYPILQAGRMDIIHLQWITMAPSHEWLSDFHKGPIIGSARGSQLTVYPRTKQEGLTVLLKSFQVVDKVHCVSNSMLEACLQYNVPREKLFVNYNGIDIKIFTTKDKLSVRNEVTLVSTGALMWRKGFIYQIQAMKMLKEMKVPARLKLIGSGLDEIGLKYLSIKLGVDENVEFLGELSEKQIIEELQQSDIYVSTSAAEGLANSALEAASCGLPIVAFKCEGMDEIIDENRSGFIIDYGDLSLFVDRLVCLINSKSMRVQFGEAAREKIKNEFDSEIWVDRMIESYHSMI